MFVQEYKVPLAKDIPVDFRINLLKNAPNPVGILRAKGKKKHLEMISLCRIQNLNLYCALSWNESYGFYAVKFSTACGEPPLCMSCSALFAIKHAIEAFRKDIGKDTYFALGMAFIFF